ncbi:MAG: hypothetical protein ISR44_00355 [Rhodospirillales bacterium]|nr:hypothetical protein [Rhodospirillales bacterium]
MRGRWDMRFSSYGRLRKDYKCKACGHLNPLDPIKDAFSGTTTPACAQCNEPFDRNPMDVPLSRVLMGIALFAIIVVMFLVSKGG